MLEPAAQPIFLKYRNALLAIGVDFSDELITDLIEDCHQNLESRLQSVVAYYCWLQSQNKDVIDQSISELLTRYKITKPALYTRFKGLGIDTFKVGRKAYVKSEDVELLDKLDKHIHDGGTITDFVHVNKGSSQLSQTSSQELTEPPQPIPVSQSDGWLNS